MYNYLKYLLKMLTGSNKYIIQYGGRGRNTVILFRCETEIPIYFSPRPGRQGNVCLAAYHFIGFSREMTVYFPLRIQFEYCVILLGSFIFF